jgi:serine protease AprX
MMGALGSRKRRRGFGRTRLLAAWVVATVALSVVPANFMASGAVPSLTEPISMIVRAEPGAEAEAAALVRSLGGRVERHIDIIHGFSTSLPPDSLDELRSSGLVSSVTPDQRVQLNQFSPSYDPAADPGSLYNATHAVQAQEMWKKGYTGEGVGVALIDSGVVPVEGLRTPGKVVNGIDLSFESQAPELRHLDTYGHGTHMAGIIAGRDDASPAGAYDDRKYFAGVAPDAHIINVKVADYEGATDVSQIIAGIDWVVQHRNDPGLNIRVLNLSFGTDGVQDYKLDPLAYAVEVAWRKGIVVVVSAGNTGYGTPKLNNPAYDPFVIAVGADAAKGTHDPKDDIVPDWSSRGDGTRNPDVVAPGVSVTSLRVPGSYLDQTYPGAVRYERFFKGNGTSQSAAVVSGAVALLVERWPTATPDQIKRLLTSTAHALPKEFTNPAQGHGIIDLKKVADQKGAPKPTSQVFAPSTGLGSIDAARGSATLSDDGIPLDGEVDIFGDEWIASTWAPASLAETSWAGGLFNGKSWSSDCWCADSWSGKSWSAILWEGKSWSGKSWSSIDFTGKSWSGKSWSGDAWDGKSWSGKSWSGNFWSGVGWSE